MQGKVRVMRKVWDERVLGIPERHFLIIPLGDLGHQDVERGSFVLLGQLKTRLRLKKREVCITTANWRQVPWHVVGQEACMTSVLKIVDCDILPSYDVLRTPEASITWLRRDIGRPQGRVRYRFGTFTYTTTSGRSLVWTKKSSDKTGPTGTLCVDFGNEGSVELLCQIMTRLGLPEELLVPMG